MKKIINILIFVFSISLGFVSCDDPFAGEDFAAYTEQPMSIYLETKEEYSSWVELLKRADLYNALNTDDGFTCFVGNNEAVARYLKNNNFASIDVLTEEQAWAIMSYHIVPNVILQQEALGGQIMDKTASGNYLLVEFDSSNPDAPKFVQSSEIINYNQEVINGVVHEIGEVLQPPLYNVGELLAASDRYEILNEAVILSGVDKYLNITDIPVDYETVKDYKTILAVTDSVFALNGISSIDDLLKHFGGSPKDKRKDFYKFVAYHVLPGSLDYNTLITRESAAKGQNFLTYAQNQYITVTDDGGLTNYINAHDPIDKEVRFNLDRVNIIGVNGYIHEVDKLMDVVAPFTYPFTHELTTDKEFEVLDFYRGPNTQKIEEFKGDDSLEFIEMVTVPSGVGLIKYRNMGNVTNMPMSFNDYLIVELGDMGYVEFTIPPLIVGRYNLVVYKWQYWAGVDKATDSSRPGTCQTYFNNIKVGGPMNHGDSHTFRYPVGELHVTEMKESKLKFKLTKRGPMAFDRITFEPIQ